MKKFTLYWRIFFLVTLLTLYFTNVISQFLILTALSGILMFSGIPWLFSKVREK